jgi:hypothetical protein
MYESNTTYKNRSNKEYSFNAITDNTYKFIIEDFGYGRVGGKEGQDGLDLNDLGMFDPSGGPYIALGTKVDDREIVRISTTDEGYLVEVA